MRTRSATLRMLGMAFDALLTVASSVASFLTLAWLAGLAHADPSLSMTAAVLAIVLWRRVAARHGLRATLGEFAMLPLVGVSAFTIGWLLLHVPIAGAVAFIAGMFVSIYLRAFGERARRLGSLIALPLVAILVVPAPAAPPTSLASIVLALLVGVVALAWVRLFALFSPTRTDAQTVLVPPRERKPGTMAPSTRMALQMGTALAAAFIVGEIGFPQHWSWAVLTAFIVCSGNRGRDDVVYKSVLRLGGAIVGTLVAVIVARSIAPQGLAEGVIIFSILFVGVWLRNINYAYWAACMTLVVSLLQQNAGETAPLVLALRLEEMLVGALCGALASWFVFPIRTESVALLHLAGALRALDADELPLLDYHVGELGHLYAPLDLHRRITHRRDDDEHPAQWIAAVRRCVGPLKSYRGNRGALKRAIGDSRRAVGIHVRRRRGEIEEPIDADATITAALRRLYTTAAAQPSDAS